MAPMRSRIWIAAGLLALCLIAILVYHLPPVHDRLAWRLESWRTQVYYALNPPQQAVFIPQQQNPLPTLPAASPTTPPVAEPASATPTLLPSPATATLPAPSETPTASPTPGPTPTAIPTAVVLKGITHEYQKFNNCGPATLSMALSYWGWKGNQIKTRSYLRPLADDVDDKNVSPSEMVTFVETQAGLKAMRRYGGSIELLKRLTAAGFPVIVEKGFELPKEDWMGHYELVSGYDDRRGKFITQDAYIMPDFPLPYDQMQERWRDFNYVYVVVYEPAREAALLMVLGPDADAEYNLRAAADRAIQESKQFFGRDLFFAYFNLGTSLAELQEYAGAAQAYDLAFALYPRVEEADRPWRMLWYQQGPYAAYYGAGRYQDVINLANTTLAYLATPTLEESLYWRGMARLAIGEQESGIADLQRAASLNPNYPLPRQQLSSLGIALP